MPAASCGKKHPLIVENFLDASTVRSYCDFAASSSLWESHSDPLWSNRSINICSMPHCVRESVLHYRMAVKDKIRDFFAVTDQLYCDIFQFVAWRVGDSLHPPHADAAHADGTPHAFHYRHYAAVTYLNDNYQGGEIYFTEFDNFKPKLLPGTLVIFPTTLEYLHGVTEIQQGQRYTIAGFFTMDKTKHDGYQI